MSTYRTALRRLAAAVLTAWGGLQPASATSYVAIADEDLLDRSPVVVVGRVVTVEAAPVDGLPAVDYRVEVESNLKGAFPAGSSLLVRVPGGVRSDGVGVKIWGAPRLAEGEEALLFLEPRRDGTFALHQLMLGVFHLGTLGAHQVAWRDLDGARELSPAGKAAPADGMRDFAAFRKWIADRVRGRPRAPDYFIPADDLPDSGAGDGSLTKFELITSTTEPPPLGCGEGGGHPVRWFASRSPWPVTWRYQVEGQPGLEDGGLPEFLDALHAWGDDPNTPVAYLHFGGTRLTNGFVDRDGVNAVIFGDPNDEIGGSFADGGILAIGGPWFFCEADRYAGQDFHPIVEADIVFQDGIEEFFDTFPDPSAVGEELFAHELGHTLGLGHSPRRDALMHAQIHADGRGAAHHVDDLAAAFFLYGRPDLPIDTDGSPRPFLSRPEAPSGVSASSEGFEQVSLTWTDRSSSESNFRVERRLRGELAFVLAGNAPAGRETFVDTVTPEAAYTYRVFAQNGAGRSPASEMVFLRLPEDRRPRPPSNLWTAAISRASVRLTWQDRSDDETGFEIEFREAGDWTTIPDPVPPDVTTVELEGLRTGTRYDFRVRSTNDFGDSATSNVSSSMTFPGPSPCFSRDRRLCFEGGRLRVEVEFVPPGRERGIPATVLPLTDRSGVFWFFDAGNPEVALRLFDDPGGEFLTLAISGLTSLEFRVTVSDRQTGEVSEYRHAAGGPCDPAAVTALRFPRTKARPAGTSSERRRSAAGPGALDPPAVTLVPRQAPRGAGTTPCRREDGDLCFFDERFAARVELLGEGGPDTSRPALGLAGVRASGFFAFDDAAEPDVVFKMLDGRAVNGRFWVFSSPPLRPASYRLTVTDTFTGQLRSYDYSAGSGCFLADTTSFAIE